MKTIFFLITLLLIGCSESPSTPNVLSSMDSLKAEQAFMPTENNVLHPSFDDNKLHGFGILKIGYNEDSIISIFENEYHYKFVTLNNKSKLTDFTVNHMFDKNSNILYGDYIIRTVPPQKTTDLNEIDNTFWCSDISTYYLLHYKINTVDIDGVFLIFYKRKLVKIKCDYSGDLENTVIAKYGKPTHNISDYSSGQYYDRVWPNGIIKFEISSILGCELGVKNVDDFLYAKDSPCRNQKESIEQKGIRSDNKEF
jgi:hypothetical protein